MGDEDKFVQFLKDGKLFIGTDFIFDEVQSDVFEKLWANANYGRRGSDFWDDSNTQVKVYSPGQRGYSPPGGYIDAGLVLTKGITITREDFENMTNEEWQELQNATSDIPNLVVEEILKDKLMWVYTTTPVITHMPDDA